MRAGFYLFNNKGGYAHDVQAKVDWIGTKPYIYKDEVTYNATSIDFSLAGDDNRYKLIVLKSENNTHYKIVQYGIKPGSQKPFPIDIPFEQNMLPIIEQILHDVCTRNIKGNALIIVKNISTIFQLYLS